MKILVWFLSVLPAAALETQTATAVGGPWSKSVTLPAEALPYHRIHLGTQVTGWVGEVRADIGSRVEKDDLLATIRAPEAEAAAAARSEEARAAKQLVVQAECVLQAVEATAAAVASETQRLSHLAASGTVTPKTRDEAKARAAAADAQVGQARAAVAAAEAEALAAAARASEAAAVLESTRLTAPFAGLVVERHAEPGDFLAAGSARAKLFVLEQTQPLRIRIHIPEHAAALADAGDAVVLQISGSEIHAKLSRVAGSLDPVTKTMAAEVDARSSSILPGAMGSATITLATLDNALRIPLSALRTAADGSRFVKTQDGANTRDVPVTLAAVDGKTAILAAGPANGTTVVIP